MVAGKNTEDQTALQKKKLAADILWNVSALVLMNGVLQFVIYPKLNSTLGVEAFGNILYIMGILAIFASAAGSAANNTRLVVRQEMPVKNGDFLFPLCSMIVLFACPFLLATSRHLHSVSEYILLTLLFALTTLRCYADVEYRLMLRYKGYFGFYAIISSGYLLGAFCFLPSFGWIFCFLLGEIGCILLLMIQGHIFWPLDTSENYKTVRKKMWVLAGSYLIYNGVLNLDRILLQNIVDSTAVTIYYVASLLGKTVALLVGPLNGIVIGYLTKGNVRILKRQFYMAVGFCALLGGMLYVATIIVTPILVRLLYFDISEEVLKLAPIGNLSQIICFSASLLLTVMLTFCDAKLQLVIQGSYGMLFLLPGIAATRLFGITGFVIAGLIANCVRFFVITVVGIHVLKKER